jgi:hypothetical protein
MKPRTIIGTLLIVVGVGLFATGGLVLAQALDRNAADDDRIRRAEVSCREQLVRIGRVTPRENEEIELEISDTESEDGLRDPRSALADATAALAMCPGREILEACVGTTCGTSAPGPIRMTLRLGLIR